MAEKIYDKDEVARIIRRAAELEADRSLEREVKEKSGPTLDEICNVASDSGIDPELIRAAALEPDPAAGLATGATANKSKQDASSKSRTDDPSAADGRSHQRQSLSHRLGRYFGMPGTGSYWKKKANAPDVKIQGLEMCYEQWMDRDADQETLNQLMSELNHRFDSPDQNGLFSWVSSNGKARIKKSGSSTEWYYTDTWGMYQTRVLMQSRNGRFRLRISRKNAWNTAWVEDEQYMLISLPIMAAGGGFLTYMTLGMAIPGILAGALIFAFMYPFIRHSPASATIKHGREIQQLGDDLTAIALEFSAIQGAGHAAPSATPEIRDTAERKKPSLTIDDITIDVDNGKDKVDAGKETGLKGDSGDSSVLKNKLRS
jgi:hypothetical protein